MPIGVAALLCCCLLIVPYIFHSPVMFRELTALFCQMLALPPLLVPLANVIVMAVS